MTNPSALNAAPGARANRRLDAVEARLAALEAAPPAQPTTWVRHVNSGTEYEVLGQAQIQTWAPLSNDALVVVYRERNGILWARPTDEFRDGRFTPCVPPTLPASEDALGRVRGLLAMIRGNYSPIDMHRYATEALRLLGGGV